MPIRRRRGGRGTRGWKRRQLWLGWRGGGAGGRGWRGSGGRGGRGGSPSNYCNGMWMLDNGLFGCHGGNCQKLALRLPSKMESVVIFNTKPETVAHGSYRIHLRFNLGLLMRGLVWHVKVGPAHVISVRSPRKMERWDDSFWYSFGRHRIDGRVSIVAEN